MNAVFADTFYWLGLINRADAMHARCMQFSCSFRGNVVTTAWVLTEAADALSAPAQRRGAATFVRQLHGNRKVRIIPPTQVLFDRGLRLFEDRPDKAWSLTDCISFVVMREERLTDALTGDHHFDQAGFIPLLK